MTKITYFYTVMPLSNHNSLSLIDIISWLFSHCSVHLTSLLIIEPLLKFNRQVSFQCFQTRLGMRPEIVLFPGIGPPHAPLGTPRSCMHGESYVTMVTRILLLSLSWYYRTPHTNAMCFMLQWVNDRWLAFVCIQTSSALHFTGPACNSQVTRRPPAGLDNPLVPPILTYWFMHVVTKGYKFCCYSNGHHTTTIKWTSWNLFTTFT